jgi:putative SOS response-associated peptidase YedK
MCGRYTVFSTYAEMQAHFGLENNINFPASYNAAPSQKLPIVIGNRIQLATWGYVPEWGRSKDIKAQINARSETAAEKPFFLAGFQARRCLVPTNGFYEWEKTRGGKQPWYFYHRQGLMAFAGLYCDGTFCILTKESGVRIAQVHGRMPVVVPKERYGYWFNADPQSAALLIRKIGSREIDGYKVSARVNAPANNEATLIERMG